MYDKEERVRCVEVARRHDMLHGSPYFSWELLMVLGMNVGLRIGDLSSLKVKHVRAPEDWRLFYKAEKTGKELGDGNGQIIPASCRSTIMRLTEGRDPEDWLFRSRQAKKYSGEPNHISRQRAWEVIRQIADEADVHGHIGCHTLRKTFGYLMYQSTNDIEKVKKYSHTAIPR